MAARRALDGWSRLVGWLKVVLPLAALALLSTLFLVSSRVDPDAAIPYATVDVESRLKEPRLTKPTFAGTTRDGAALTVQAAEARPGATPQDPSTASVVTGTLATPDGQTTDIRADNAVIDPGANTIRLTGAVNVKNSTGYQIEAEELTADLRETGLASDRPVTATGPAGRVTADSMTLTRAASGQDSYLLVFKGHVKLVYTQR